MIKLNQENHICKLINSIKPSEIYYDKNRFTLFIYADNATEAEKAKMRIVFLNYIDLNNLQEVYSKIVIYS